MFPHPEDGYPSYEEALDEYDRALGWSPEDERDGTLDDYDAWAEHVRDILTCIFEGRY